MLPMHSSAKAVTNVPLPTKSCPANASNSYPVNTTSPNEVPKASSVPMNVWIVSDREMSKTLRESLLPHHCRISKCIELDVFRSPASRGQLLTEIKKAGPDLFWIHASALENKLSASESKYLAITLSVLMQWQLDAGKHIVLEGSLTKYSDWHPERLSKVLQHPRLTASHVYWCGLGLTDSSGPICRYSRIICTLPSLPQRVLQCCGFLKKKDKRSMKSSKLGLQAYQSKLADLLLPAFHDSNFVFPNESTYVANTADGKPRPNLPKKAPKVHEALDPDEPGEHADLEFTKEETKKPRKPHVEEVYDDCGDDLTAISEDLAFVMFEDASTEAPHTSDDDDSSEEELFDSAFYSWGFPGSDPKEEDLNARPFSEQSPDIHSFLLALDAQPGIHDVCEYFGGQGAVIRLSVRRKLRAGPNFDITCDVDLLNPEHLKAVWSYMQKHRPRVVVGGPPCTAFSAWQHLNKQRNPEGYLQALRIGTRLANLMADIVVFQQHHKNHFLIENPLTSELWRLSSWIKIRNSEDVFETVLDQCMVGLRDPEGHFTRKSTLLVASHPALIRRLQLRCDHSHQHVQLAGSVQGVQRTRWAQAWPRRMVELIVDGIQEVLRTCYAFPARAVISCPGCRAHAARHDARHDRSDDCKFPHDAPVTWNCASCKAFRPSTHAGHSFEIGDCQWAEARTRQFRGKQLREPRVPPRGAPPEAAEPEPAAEPKPVPSLEWIALSDLEMITQLDSIRGRDGWFQLQNGDMALTSTNCRALRSCEPRLNAQQFPFRSTFCLWPEHTHRHGAWWQLENHARFTDPSYDTRMNLPQTAPVCISIFHQNAGSPPFQNITGVRKPASAGPLKPAFAPSSSSSRNPLQEAMDRWDQEDEGEEPEVPVLAPEPAPAEPPLGEDIPIPEPEWSNWDLGRMLRSLRSTSETPQKIRTLRRLHQRWYHCTAARMRALLSAAGVDSTTLNMIPDVVDTCKACRQWRRPTARSVHSSRLTTRFNEAAQIDILFLEESMALVVIDEATRFTVAIPIADRSSETVISAITNSWVMYFGAPKTLISDREGAVLSDELSIWAERRNIDVKPRPRDAHATIVERHHQLLREQFLKMRSACQLENLPLPFASLLSEAVYAKNALISVGGFSPFQAVLGIHPQFLSELEGAGQSALTDDAGGILGASRHSVRLREIALEAMINSTAKMRLQRAEQSKTRIAGQHHDYTVGEAVDIYRQPQTKSLSGWRGPCTIVSVHDVESGYIDVRWQGRVIAARLQDVRRHVFLISYFSSGDHQVQILRQYLNQLSSPSVSTFAYVETPKGWQLSRAATEHPEVFNALRFSAGNHFGLDHCIGARIGRGPQILSGVANAERTVLSWWPSHTPELYKTIELTPEQRIDLRTLFTADTDTCWIQFICLDHDQAKKLIRLIPDDPYLQPRPSPRPPLDPNLEEARRRVPVPRPMSTGVTTRHPVDTGSTMHEDDHPMPPPRPPSSHGTLRSDRFAPSPPRTDRSRSERVKPSPPGTDRSHTDQPEPRHTDRSRSDRRDPIPTNTTTPSTLPPMYPPSLPPTPVPSDRLSPVRRGVPSDASSSHRAQPRPRTEHSTPASSSWQVPPNIAPLQPVAPFGDDIPAVPEDDEVSLPSTIEYEADDVHAVFEQFAGVANSTTCPEVLPELKFLNDLEDYKPIHTLRECVFLMQPPRPLEPGEFCVYDVLEKATVIERGLDELTAKEVRENKELVDAAVLKELGSFVTHKCFEPKLKRDASNILSSRMLLRWKIVDDVRTIKARLVVHGFKDDAASSLKAYASTTSRWGQRLVCSVAASRKWKLLSADVSTAFLQGVSFAELSRMTGEPLRSVSFSPPKAYEHLFKKLPGLQNINFEDSCLAMHKPIYGLKDAPRAWRKRLHQILVECGGRALSSDDSLYVFHEKGELTCLLSTHVDDLKVTGEDSTVDRIFKTIESHVGKLKIVSAFKSSFEHCGVMHSQSEDYSITLSQDHYAARLRPVDTAQLNKLNLDALLSEAYIALYLSLLGGLSWLTQTRSDLAIYIQALQRASKAPRTEHLLRLSKVCSWARRESCTLFYSSALDATKPTKVLGVGDSAFRRETSAGLAMRGALVCVAQKHDTHPGGVCHVIEFYSRRQRRVTRSTYAAELLSLSDCFDVAKLIAYAVAEISQPMSPKQLTTLEESGSLPIPIELCVDARGVFDSLVSEQSRCSEAGLIMTLLALKESLRSQLLSRLWWIDTRDMLADGLTKGTVPRRGLMSFCSQGVWNLTQPCLPFAETTKTVINNDD